MKCLGLYYSGAGNTEFIMNRIGAKLKTRGDEVVTRRIQGSGLSGFDDDFDALILGFPIYFRAPQPLVIRSLEALQGRGGPLILFCTKGLYSGNVMRVIVSLAKQRGFSPRGYHEFYMPGSDALILYCPKGSIRERFFKSIHSRNIDRKVEGLINKLNDPREFRAPRRKWYTWLDEKIVMAMEDRFAGKYNIFVEQFRSMPDRCVKCMRCVRECPNSNIEMTGSGVVFGENCDTCFRCIHHCPTEAIQIGDKTLDHVRYRPSDDLLGL
jgi:ferredoxin